MFFDEFEYEKEGEMMGGEKKGFFSRLVAGLTKTRDNIVSGIDSIFSAFSSINDEFYEKQKDKWLHTGDVVMVQSGHVGHAAVIPEELDNTAAHALIMFRNPKTNTEPYFMNYQYQTDKSKKKIENITTGNTIKHILASDMQNFVVDVPKYEEQKAIGDYFSTLDRLITLHQRKYNSYKKEKLALLQQVFI